MGENRLVLTVVQRVSSASVDVEESGYHVEIGSGLCVLLAVEQEDGAAEVDWIARKLARLRVFRDDDGRMNRSIQDVDGAVLLVSQFTLVGDCTKGNRPSFVRAADPGDAERLDEDVASSLRTTHHLSVKTGQFAAMMDVAMVNDGPVTLILQTPRKA